MNETENITHIENFKTNIITKKTTNLSLSKPQLDYRSKKNQKNSNFTYSLELCFSLKHSIKLIDNDSVLKIRKMREGFGFQTVHLPESQIKCDIQYSLNRLSANNIELIFDEIINHPYFNSNEFLQFFTQIFITFLINSISSNIYINLLIKIIKY